MPFFDPGGQTLWTNGAVFAAAAAIVWFGGTRLTRALDAISDKSGASQVFVGMLLLGGITSLPEVANVITSSLNDVPQLAINNLLGSVAINVLLLALVDAVVGRKALTGVIVDAATLMMCALCMIVLAIVAAAILVGDVAILGVGLWSVTICLASIGAFALAVGYGERAPWRIDEQREPKADVADHQSASMTRLVAVSIIAAAAIFAAGFTLSLTGEAIAEQTGLGAGFVGFVLIGLATSLPELSTITAALKLQRHEMAFGQVLGSNFVNISFFLLADLFYSGGAVVNELGRFEAVLTVLALMLIGVFLVGLLERRDAKILRMGYDSFVVILLFLAGAALLYTLR